MVNLNIHNINWLSYQVVYPDLAVPVFMHTDVMCHRCGLLEFSFNPAGYPKCCNCNADLSSQVKIN